MYLLLESTFSDRYKRFLSKFYQTIRPKIVLIVFCFLSTLKLMIFFDFYFFDSISSKFLRRLICNIKWLHILNKKLISFKKITMSNKLSMVHFRSLKIKSTNSNAKFAFINPSYQILEYNFDYSSHVCTICNPRKITIRLHIFVLRKEE